MPRVPLWMFLPLMLMTPVLHATCLEPTSREEVRRQLAVAEQELLSARYEEARRVLETAREASACTSEVLDMADLYRFQLLLGTAQLLIQQDRLAAESYAQALRFTPEGSWDPNLGARGCALFQAIRSRADRKASSRLAVRPTDVVLRRAPKVGAVAFTLAQVREHSAFPEAVSGEFRFVRSP